MEEKNVGLNELIKRAEDKMMSLPVGSEEWKIASEAYLNLTKARAENEKTTEKEETLGDKILKYGGVFGPIAASMIMAGAKIYEVWARRRTNQEAMYVEEVAAKYIPKTPWNNR